MPLSAKFKERLLGDRRELSIVRGMVYNNLQEWKRKIFVPEEKLNVDGTAWDGMRLSAGDMKFIDEEALKIMTMPAVELSDEQATAIAKHAYESIKSVPEASRTAPQKKFMEELTVELGLDLNQDLPF